MSVILAYVYVIINLTYVLYNRLDYTGDSPSNHIYYDSFQSYFVYSICSLMVIDRTRWFTT